MTEYTPEQLATSLEMQKVIEDPRMPESLKSVFAAGMIVEAHSGKPEPFSNEMWNYLLVNSLRLLTDEQRAGLCFDLYIRSKNPELIEKKIQESKQP